MKHNLERITAINTDTSEEQMIIYNEVMAYINEETSISELSAKAKSCWYQLEYSEGNLYD